MRKFFFISKGKNFFKQSCATNQKKITLQLETKCEEGKKDTKSFDIYF